MPKSKLATRVAVKSEQEIAAKYLADTIIASLKSGKPKDNDEDEDDDDDAKAAKAKARKAAKDEEVDDDDEEDEGDFDEEDDDDSETYSAAADKKKKPMKKGAPDIAKLVKSAGFLGYDKSSDMFLIKMDSQVMRVAPEFNSATSKAADSDNSATNDYHPSAAELKQINHYAKGKYNSPAQVKSYETRSADSLTDRHAEHFSDAALKDMRKYSPGSVVMKDHNAHSSDGVFGKIYDAKVQKDDTGKPYLNQKFYVSNTPKNADIIEGIEDGTNDKLSVSISMKRGDYLCDMCAKPMYGTKGDWSDYCGHMAGQDMGDGKMATATINRVSDFRELSRVTTPAQRASAIKSAIKTAGYDAPENEEISELAELALINLSANKLGSSKSLATLSPDQNQIEVNHVEIEKLIEAQNKSAAELIAAQKASTDAQTNQTKSVDALVAKMDSVIESQKEWKAEATAKIELLKAENTLLKTNTKATAEALDLLMKATTGVFNQMGIVVGKSVNDIAAQQATFKDMGQNRNAAEQDAAKGGNGYYEDFTEQLTKAAKTIGK